MEKYTLEDIENEQTRYKHLTNAAV